MLAPLTVNGQTPLYSESQTLDNVLAKGNTSTNVMTVNQLVYGNTNLWEDILSPAAAWNPPGTPSAATTVFNSGPSADMIALSFADAAENIGVCKVQLPHTWNTEQPDVYVHVHWVPQSTLTGTVVMALQYTEAGIGSTYYPTRTNVMVFGATNEPFRHKMATFPALFLTNGATVSHGLNMTLRRLGTATNDTYGGACFVTDIDTHYRVKGSPKEFIPTP
jgi:hypothetical protein